MPTREDPVTVTTAPAPAPGLAPSPAAHEHREPAGIARLSEGVRALRLGSGRRLNERTLMIVGGVAAPVGLLLVLLGWQGAAHTPNTYEQIPYLISGGLLGLGLVFLGAFFYFTHWLTQLVRESRSQSASLLDAITRLEATLRADQASTGGVPPSALANGRTLAEEASTWEPERPLVATSRGTMAHRLDCVVVAGKAGLRAVSADEGFLPCKLCDPYAAG